MSEWRVQKGINIQYYLVDVNWNYIVAEVAMIKKKIGFKWEMRAKNKQIESLRNFKNGWMNLGKEVG